MQTIDLAALLVMHFPFQHRPTILQINQPPSIFHPVTGSHLGGLRDDLTTKVMGLSILQTREGNVCKRPFTFKALELGSTCFFMFIKDNWQTARGGA